MLIRHPKPSQTLGERGEIAAERFLRRKGYTMLAGGQRSRYGEIDLIAVDHHRAAWRPSLRSLAPWRTTAGPRTLVFVEVKSRRSDRFGHPASAVDANKQRRLADGALAYLKANGLMEYAARFDVVAITWPRASRRPTSVEHFVDAFEPPGSWRFYG